MPKTTRRELLKILGLLGGAGLASCASLIGPHRAGNIEMAVRQAIPSQEKEASISDKKKAEMLYDLVMKNNGKVSASSDGKLYAIEARQYPSGNKEIRLTISDLQESPHNKISKQMTFIDGNMYRSLDGVVDGCSFSGNSSSHEEIKIFGNSVYQPYVESDSESGFKCRTPAEMSPDYIKHIEKILKIMGK